MQETRESEWVDTVEQAKLIRKALKREFPAVKFSVRSDRYAGGSSIHISWTDGPAAPEVEKVTDAYAGGGFDGMIDLAYHVERWLLPDGTVRFAGTRGTEGSKGTVPESYGSPMHPEARLVQFAAKYVSCSRGLSPEFRGEIEAYIAEFTGEPFDGNKRYPVSALSHPRNGELSIDTHGLGEYGFSLVHQLSHQRSR